MAIPPAYPPYQQPLLDPRTGRVSKPWQLFFLSLTSGASGLVDGSVTLVKLERIAWPRLLGRGSAGTGDVEQLTIGTGLVLSGTELAADPAMTGGGRWGGAMARRLLW